jgi:hydroxypyruvate isomerase
VIEVQTRPSPRPRNPGRHEPRTGEIDYPFLFRFTDRLGYAGWIGCEYKPAKTTLEGLGRVRSYL